MYILTGEELGQVEESASKDTNVSSGAKLRTAAHIYASQSKIRECTDANFWNIFYEPNKVLVVAFWATGCAPCNQVAEAMVKVADRWYKGPNSRIKFFHVQWDKSVNPRIYERFGFKSIPVVFFFYTATGRPPTRECPLLEGSLPDSSQKNHRTFTPEAFLWRIRSILQRHQKNTGLKRLDFYDRSDFHLAYLGQLSFPWCRNLLEIRLINQANWVNINNNSQKPKYDPAIQTAYEKQISGNSLILQVDSIENQRKQLNALFDKAKKTGKEQGVYIVFEVKNQRAQLYFQAANPLNSTETEFEFALGIPKGSSTNEEVLRNGKKIRYVPGDRDKQVIGTLHTHYIKSTPSIKQTTATGITIHSEGEKIPTIVHAVSEKDISSAKDHQIVVYAIEADQIHKAMPNGNFTNGMKKTFNILLDALESFTGKNN